VSRSRLLLGALLLLALLPRLGAVRWNAWPHGDVLLDAAVVDALATRGELKVPIVDVRFYPLGRFGFGYPPDQHPPLWSLLGVIPRLLGLDSYQALQLVALAAGLALLPAVYACGRDLFGPGAGRFAAALCASSFLLIDFSGNGSLWSLLALIYVLFAWRLSLLAGSANRVNALLLGLLMGLAYLTNYPAVVLPATLVAVVGRWWLERRRAGKGGSGGAPAPALPDTALALLVAGLMVLPWLLFNLATFGNPVWSQPLQRQLGGGDKQVEVVVENGEVVKRALPGGDPLGERLRSTAANLYGNLGFLVRQSFVLLPFTGGFVLAGLASLGLVAPRGRAGRALPLLVLTLAHGALILLWPTTKFRYLVPLFPLAALLAGGLLWQLQPVGLRRLLAVLALGLGAFTSLWSWASIPSHTYYYDGGVVGDNFGAQGEIAYVEDLRRLAGAASAIRTHGPGPVLGPHPLYTLAGQPLVINSAAFSPAVVRNLVERYSVRYIVAEPPRQPFYADLFPVQTLWQDERYVVMALW
jgi:4-amino-4-deoxy-L-arabinose transferase-like glycosyltransferase